MERENTCLFITATHGDEDFSIETLSRLEKRYPKEKYGYDWIIGNPRALAKNQRFIEADLNRSAPGNYESTIYEERRAAEIIELSKRYSYIIDIHGTVADCGIVSIIPYPTFNNLLLAAAFSFERNVIWFARTSLEKGPLVQFTDCPGIEIECGPKMSQPMNYQLESILENFLDQRLRMGLDQLLAAGKGKQFYYVYDKQEQDGNTYSDFALARNHNEEFYPFLSNQYPGIACYKMKKTAIESFFLT